MLNTQVTMSTDTLLNLLRRREAEPHTVLSSERTWHSPQAMRAQDEHAFRELSRIGLAGPNGLDRGLLTTVDVIARPTLEYYAWIAGGHDGKPVNYTVLGCSGGGEAVLLARNADGEGVILESVRPDELMTGFLAQVPGLPPGKGNEVTAPRSEVTGEGGGADDGDSFQVMRSHRPTPSGEAAAELQRVLTLPRLGGGRLYVAARNRAGTRHRADKPVSYIDTREGRWLTDQVAGAGEPMIRFSPATPQLLADRLRKAQSELPV